MSYEAPPTSDPGFGPNFLYDVSAQYSSAVENLLNKLEASQAAVAADPSNPQKLAEHQALFSEYTLFRNALSNIIKSLKDVSQGVVQNYR